MKITDADALIVVDVQNDFCPGGALEVPGGDEVVPVINRLMPRFPTVVFTRDWHPPGHKSFASSHPGKGNFEVIEMPYGPQTLWPVHCVAKNHGAEFHPHLLVGEGDTIVSKGTNPDIDSYSAFIENDKRTHTAMAGILNQRGVSRVFLTGLAFDFCVGFSALDAVTLGFRSIVIEDACRAIDLDGSRQAMLARLREHGVELISSDQLLTENSSEKAARLGRPGG